MILLICLVTTGCELIDGSVSDVEGPTLVGTPDGDTADNACYLYTPQIVEDTFKYLDEIYIEKYFEHYIAIWYIAWLLLNDIKETIL